VSGVRNYLKTHAGCVAGGSGPDARRGDAGDAAEGIVEEPQRRRRLAAAATRRDARASGRRRCPSSSPMLSATLPPRSLPAARIPGVAARVGFEIVSRRGTQARLRSARTGAVAGVAASLGNRLYGARSRTQRLARSGRLACAYAARGPASTYLWGRMRAAARGELGTTFAPPGTARACPSSAWRPILWTRICGRTP
jgi:hypothetical protein